MDKPIIIEQNFHDTLAGHFLVATPQLKDEMFSRTVIYMCAHNAEGGMGVIVNKPIDNITMNEILEQMQLKMRMGDRKLPLLFGGPVETHRGFVLHNGFFLQDTAVTVRDNITVTANASVLHGWLEGAFSAKAMLALGYAGWMPGQLESEIEQGSWVSIPATEQLLFDTPNDEKWNLAIASLGFDMGNFSNTVGHA